MRHVLCGAKCATTVFYVARRNEKPLCLQTSAVVLCSLVIRITGLLKLEVRDGCEMFAFIAWRDEHAIAFDVDKVLVKYEGGL